MIRLIAILVFICSMISARTYSQKVSIKVKNGSLPAVLKSIEKQSGYSFVYPEEWMKKAGPVSVDFQSKPLIEALGICLRDQPFTYKIVNKTIALKLMPQTKSKPVKDSASSIALPPLEPIQGIVTDSAGIPLANVSVIEKGTTTGTTTDNEGRFSLPGIERTGITLVFVYTGYAEHELTIDGKSPLNVVLYVSHNVLDAVQTIAYGTITKRLNTGSVSTVTAEEIAKQPISNPLAALEGRVPGLYISQSTGNANGAFKVMLRGQNSIAAGNIPLYIIDGVQYTSNAIGSPVINGSMLVGGNPMSSINPTDIESITILKDADATAIYGSRGANGVIIITTKKGLAGKTKVDLNLYSGFEKVAHKLDLLNTQQYLEMRHEAFKNDNAAPQSWDYDVNGTWDTTRYTDWQKKLIGNTANLTNIQASISGGNESTQFRLSSNYHHETTVYPGDFSDRIATISLSLTNSSSNNRLKTNFSTSYTSNIDKTIPVDLTSLTIATPPNTPAPYDSTGKLDWASGFGNPYAILLQEYRSNTKNLISNIILSYKINKNLILKASGGYTDLQVDEIRTLPEASINPANFTQQRSSVFGTNEFKSWIIEPQATWQSKLGNGELNILLGTTFQENDQAGQTLNASGYTSDDMLENISGASTITKNPSSPPIDIKYRYQAVFGRINYNLANRYILNLTGRRDGSSRFGKGRQFANFGAIGAAWIFSEEKFIKENFHFLSFGKLRTSYGTTGNDQIPDYGYLSTYTTTTYPYQGNTGLIATRLANPDYGWETNKKLEAGFDLGFLKDKILLSVDYYRNRSSNQLVGYGLPALTGFSSVQYNLPALVQNTGIEIEFNTKNIRSSTFEWSSSLNISIPKNKLVSYPNIEGSNYANKYEVGKSLQIYKSYHYLSVDPQQGVYVFQSVADGAQTANPIYPNDLQAIKQAGQKYYGGLLNNFRYKSWQLGFLFQFVKQVGFSYMYSGFDAPGMMSNQMTVVLDRWKKPGDKTNIQRFSQDYGSAAVGAFYNSIFYGDNVLTDASFVRLKNISLAYSINERLLKKLHLQNCKIYVQGQNLWTITNYLGFDPENQDVARVPPLRTVTAGIQLTF